MAQRLIPVEDIPLFVRAWQRGEAMRIEWERRQVREAAVKEDRVWMGMDRASGRDRTMTYYTGYYHDSGGQHHPALLISGRAPLSYRRRNG